MITRPLVFAILTIALSVSTSASLCAQQLTVNIEGLRNTIGDIHIGFYDSDAQWQTEKSNFQRHTNKAKAKNGSMSVTFDDIPAGHYGLAIVDDENSSGGMDWGLLFPKEGFGFSNYYHRGILRPSYTDFDFDLPKGENVLVTVKVRYL